jgi:hypothetical protein
VLSSGWHAEPVPALQNGILRYSRFQICATSGGFRIRHRTYDPDHLDGLLPAPDECISHITRLYLKKQKEVKKLKRYRRVALAGSRIFIRAWQQVEAWECRGQMRLTEALVPARVWALHGQRASRTGGKKG